MYSSVYKKTTLNYINILLEESILFPLALIPITPRLFWVLVLSPVSNCKHLLFIIMFPSWSSIKVRIGK